MHATSTGAAGQLPQADRFYDRQDGNPLWNESVWFSISQPERLLHGFIQYYFRPNMGMLNGGPVLWDPSGTFGWNCLHYNWSHLQPMPPGARKFDMTARNSLSVKVIEPLTRYSIRYDNGGLAMDLEWTASGPIHILNTHSAEQAETARFHLEQPGRLCGTVQLDGERIAIDCCSMRDTSYGPRDYEAMASGGYFWGVAEDAAFHAIALGEDAEAKVIGGFIWRDGLLGSLVSGTRRVLEYGRYGPRRVWFEGTDDHGRTIEATALIHDGLIFTGYTDHTVVWSLMRWEWSGAVLWGDNQEFCSVPRFRRIARGDFTWPAITS